MPSTAARPTVVDRHGPGLIGTLVHTAVLAGAGEAVERTTAAYEPAGAEDIMVRRLRQLADLAEAGILSKDEYHAAMGRLLQLCGVGPARGR